MATINLEATKDLLLLYQTLTDADEQCNNLCKDQTMLKFLVYVLEETTDQIALLSLKVLAALCADDGRCNMVAQTFGLTPSLELLSTGDHEFAVKEAALRLKMRLLEAKVALIAKQQEEAVNQHLLFHGSLTSRLGDEATKVTPPRECCPSLLGQHNSTVKVVSLHIEGLFSERDKERCEEKLLDVRGVISFTFDMERRRCVVRVKPDLSPRVLIQAIKSTGTMSALQVSNSTTPRLPTKSMGTPTSESSLPEDDRGAAASLEAKEEDLPAYLPEADSPIREDAVVQHKKSKSSSAASWLGSAATFIARSLYW